MIYIGRDEKAVGAHCLGYNSVSIGICAEGSFGCEFMGEDQYNSILELTRYILNKYGISKIYGHREVYSTDCPGSNFPLDRIKREASGSSGKLIYPGYLMKVNCSLRDSNVKAVQNMLISKGYSAGRCGADGYFGEDTFEAVKKFQSNNGLLVDGIVGRDTWSRLFG